MVAVIARAAAALLCGLWVLACAAPSPVVSQRSSAIRGVELKKVALAPFTSGSTHAADVETDGIALVRSRVFEALTELIDWELVPPEEIERWLEHEKLAADDADPSAVGLEAARAFAADAVLFGHVRRYRSRQGGPRGSLQPASVWFELELRLPDGRRLWSGSYREKQAAVSDNLLALPRAASRGFQWVDASRLAREGALELVGELAREQRVWK